MSDPLPLRLYLVVCTLRAPGDEYHELFDWFGTEEGVQVGEAAWIIENRRPPSLLRSRVEASALEGDTILIVDITASPWVARLLPVAATRTITRMAGPPDD